MIVTLVAVQVSKASTLAANGEPGGVVWALQGCGAVRAKVDTARRDTAAHGVGDLNG
jgi:hypothetical protein